MGEWKLARASPRNAGALPGAPTATRNMTKIFSRREKSKFSRAVERSDTPGPRALPLIVSRQGIINRAPR